MEGSSPSFQVGVVECDISGEDIFVWCYPSFSLELQRISLGRLTDINESTMSFVKFKSDWIYLFKNTIDRSVNPRLKNVSICITSKQYNPERFYSLLKLFFDQYATTFDPTKVLESYLSIFTTGKFSNNEISFSYNNFKDEDAFLSESCMHDLVSSLGVDAVIVWNAVILKKRILVFDENIVKLMTLLRTLLQFSIHRQDASILRPFITSDVEYLTDLASSGVYIAGSNDQALLSRTDLFDVIYMVSERRIIVSPDASSSMRMCSIHKEISELMMKNLSPDERKSSMTIVQAVGAKTKSILAQLAQLSQSCEGGKLTVDVLSSKIANDTLKFWLFQLASAENMV